MSTDYELCCRTCKRYCHLGQRFASGEFTFGYGRHDLATNQIIGYWLLFHAEQNHELFVTHGDGVPDDFTMDTSFDDTAKYREEMGYVP